MAGGSPHGRPYRAATALAAATLTLLGGLALVRPASASEVVSRPPDGVLTVDGRGFGHGRGLSQYGAYGAALAGLRYDQILGFYYVGATLGTAPGAQRRVLLTGEDSDLDVSNAPELVVTDEAGSRTYDLGSNGAVARVRARLDGGLLHIEGLVDGRWVGVAPATVGPVAVSGPAVTTLHTPTGPRQFRGTVRAARSTQAAKPLYVVNTVSLDDYVRGVVAAEMPSGWHEQALRAQAVAARSYGYNPCPQPSAYPTTSLYDVVDTTACQVYAGVSSETTRTNDAVNATSTQVVRYGGNVLRAEFSASNGGWTVANGGPFVAQQDPYDAAGAAAAGSDVNRWSRVRVPLSRLEAAYGTGTLRELRVLSRDGNGEWGGRVLRIRLVGDARTVEVTGDAFRAQAQLRSNWFDLVSPIDSKYLALGGPSGFLGAPMTAETALTGGRFRQFQGGSIYWSDGTGAQEVHGSIRDRWGVTGWESGPLRWPTTDESGTPGGGGRYSHFQGGSVYWSAATGAWDVRGSIRSAWSRNRWEAGPLGFPVTGETPTPDGVGRFNHFQGGSVYWSPATDAWAVQGSIRDRWSALRWEAGPLGYPLTDEQVAPDGRGRYNRFQGGSVYWSPTTPAADVRGPLRDRWAALRWEVGPLGYPTSGQSATPDRTGLYNHFQGGSVYWSPSTGAYDVRGSIRERWASLGWEAGPLGYPVSGEQQTPEGARSDFQNGSILWDRATGQTSVVAR